MIHNNKASVLILLKKEISLYNILITQKFVYHQFNQSHQNNGKDNSFIRCENSRKRFKE